MHQQILERSQQHILTAFPQVIAIYVFGSFDTQYETTDSDVDLAVLANEPLDQVELWRLAQDIAIDIRRNVEIIDLKEASTVFRFQVITTGKRFYCSDPKKCDATENVYLSMYLRFNEERSEIIKDKWGIPASS